MGIYVNRGTTSFEMAVNSKIYVDKTGLLDYTNSVIGTEQCCICNSRPRRFGKSIAAGMLTAYYDRTCDASPIFDKFSISKTEDYKKYLNKYDVINLDITSFTCAQSDSLQAVENIHKCVIDELKKVYPGVLDENEKDLPMALAKVNDAVGAEFVIIIDEWDAIFRDDKFNDKAQVEYFNLLRGLFKSEISKKFLKLAFITGILPIKRYNSESALNNFNEFTMLRPGPLAEYFGFTEDEVKAVCDKYDMDFSEMKRWYDGYALKGLHVYNPKSVVNAVTYGEVDNYWTQTVAFESLRGYISMNYEGLQDDIVRVLAGERCSVNVRGFENDMTSFKSKDDVLTVLIHLGYLAYDSANREAFIPNEEVRLAFAQSIENTMMRTP
jgi:hypothetical protein